VRNTSLFHNIEPGKPINISADGPRSHYVFPMAGQAGMTDVQRRHEMLGRTGPAERPEIATSQTHPSVSHESGVPPGGEDLSTQFRLKDLNVIRV
jgi:hypothetical protein